MKTLKRFIMDESGLETVEWAVIAALIVAGLVGVITLLGNAVKARFETLTTAVTTP
jgi:Flp pilus assembly pilin Flp